MTIDGQLICDFYVEEPADVVLFHPLDHNILVVGTYSLDEKSRTRSGTICIYKLYKDESSDAKSSELISQVKCDAVLDLKWFNGLLYAAHSTGSLSIHTYDTTGQELSLKLNRKLLASSILILSLSVYDDVIITSHSNGTIAIWTHELQQKALFTVSDLECWIQTRSDDKRQIYVGSDDATFQVWDTRQDATVAAMKNSKTHSAGVTAIYAMGSSVYTGAYDDQIRRFDLRNLRHSVQEQNLGGGVWRIIPAGHTFLIPCMYDGAKTVDRESFEICRLWRGHESITYGADMSNELNATCSFYDKRVCVWA